MQRNRLASASRLLLALLVLAILSVLVSPAFAADAKVEKEAQGLQKKAIEEDSLGMAYPAAIKKLQTAIGKCGTDKCGVSLRASLTRDLGAMQILSGNVEEGKASFAQAIGLDPSIDLDPAYKNPMLDGIWNDVKKHGGGSGGGGATSKPPGGAEGPAVAAGPQPTGDFAHMPPVEALVHTPLAIYTEYPGSEELARVVVKYKGSGASDWKTLELKKMEGGFGALIPCKDVPQGTMRYYIQGFNENNDPVATSGSRNKPFTVPVKSQIAGDPPALPDHDPPKQCPGMAGAGDTECPPDFPGCGAPRKEGGEECERNDECKSGSCTEGKCVDKKLGGDICESDSECMSGSCSGGHCTGKKQDGEECESDDECDSGKCKESKCAPAGGKPSKIWVGLSFQFDVPILPGANNVCKLNPVTAQPLNTQGYSCVAPDNSNFPGHSSTLNDRIQLNRSDQVQSGFGAPHFPPGNVRILASIDYALNRNVLIGLHAGYVLFTDPAAAAPSAAFAPIHLEGRLTYLVGKDALTRKGIAPMIVAGLGVGEFDAYVPVTVFDTGPANMPFPQAQPHSRNAWLTAGPFFLAAGGGARFALSPHVGLFGVLKVEGAFGGSAGFLPGIAPEIGMHFGL